VNGEVILYADKITDSMRKAINETNRRRAVQAEYNRQNNITPQSIKKNIQARSGPCTNRIISPCRSPLKKQANTSRP